MKFQNLMLTSLFATLASTASAAECLTEAPATVYEAEEMSPQNMDFDRENMLFIAHPGWYNDALVHYYKFRIFAPATYEGVIAPGSTAGDVPTQKMYLVTTTGGFDGVIGKPIIEYHNVDGTLYSDFMEINFVTAPEGYVEDDFKSVKDIMASAATVTPAETLVNMPVVPTGSYLQDPASKGTNRAPIDPVPVWYNCVEVWTYVFEVTSEDAANHFSYTRSPQDVATARAGESGFEISVTPSMGSASTGNVNAIPIWHVNQYQRGVVEGTGGGPDPNGMRNVINLDRPDAGYSPLWQVFWATNLPIDYSANQASSNTAMTSTNGFEFFTTPMFVNCPNIGPVNKEALNADRQDSFMTTVNTAKGSTWILGSHMTLIFQPDMPITFSTQDGVEFASTATNMMGAYEYELLTADIPEGTTMIKVMFKEELIRAIEVVEDATTIAAEDGEDEAGMSTFTVNMTSGTWTTTKTYSFVAAAMGAIAMALV